MHILVQDPLYDSLSYEHRTAFFTATTQIITLTTQDPYKT